MGIKKFFKKAGKFLKSKPWIRPLAVAILFAIVGLFAYRMTQAAPNAVSVDLCEETPLSGDVYVGHDHANTSCGHYVSFGFNPPTNVSTQLRKVAGGMTAPTDIASTGVAGDQRLFITTQRGQIYVSNKDGGNGSVFLDLSSKVSFGSERGLLGITFDPNYAQNGYFYVNYTANSGRGTFNGQSVNFGDTVVSRFTRSGNNTADPNSELIIMGIDHPNENHNGGGLQFGRDGFLYISTGDGGGGGDQNTQNCWYGNGQCLNTYLGKILRIDVNGANTGQRYKVPAGNPFTNTSGAKAEIWHYGLRNPWRISFDRKTGDMFIADVGQNQWEEVSFAASGQSGKNYGWRCFEGTHNFNLDKGNCQHTPPIYEYGRDKGCSVTGGYVYRGTAYPEFDGTYIFSDYCTSTLRYLTKQANGSWKLNQTIDAGLGQGATTFGQDIAGELYVGVISGNIYKIEVTH